MPPLGELFRDARARRSPIVGVTTGSGPAVQAAVASGADMVLALSSSLYRGLGWGTLAAFMPFGDANQQTHTLIAQRILPHAGDCPIVAGLFASPDDSEGANDATFDSLRDLRVQAVTNWPALGQLDGVFRQALQESGFTTEWEIEALRQARRRGFATLGFAFHPLDARAFAQSGVDALILGLGLTRRYEDIHERRDRIQQEITRLNAMLDAVAQSGRRRPACLVSGGSVIMPEDFEHLLRFCRCDGFVGGSAFESIPVRDIVGSMVRRFKSVALNPEQPEAITASGGKRTGGGAGVPAREAQGLGAMIGRSAPMKELFARIRRVAPHDVNVCVEGESGTGKEMVAAQLHRMSKRAHQAFVSLNCGAIPDALLESELFGHEKGAFTGADRRRLGKFEQAHRGTLFLDEIANLSPHGQVALLRAIQQREISRVGGEAYIPVDVRVLSATNQSLPLLVEQGKFRADLFHRLNQFTLSLPALRARGDDIPLLVDDYLPRVQIQLDKKLLGISPGFLKKLKEHAWPGNVRELQHVVLGAALCEEGPVLHGSDFAPSKGLSIKQGSDWSAAWLESVRQAMQDAAGNKSRAAAALGVTRKTLYSWLRELDGINAKFKIQNSK